MTGQPLEHPDVIADFFASWCGETAWSIELRRFGALGGLIRYWCGVPRSHSAIPLTFALHWPSGTPMHFDRDRLRDIKLACQLLERLPAKAEGAL